MQRHDVRDRAGADVAGRAVADAVGRRERRARLGPAAVHAVAEAERRGAVGLDLDDELGRVAVRAEQVDTGVHGSVAASSVLEGNRRRAAASGVGAECVAAAGCEAGRTRSALRAGRDEDRDGACRR